MKVNRFINKKARHLPEVHAVHVFVFVFLDKYLFYLCHSVYLLRVFVL